MNEMTTKELMNHHHHIDNGGITTIVKADYHPDGEFAGASLEMHASFYGYTEHNFRIHNVDSSYLRELALRLIQAADALETP